MQIFTNTLNEEYDACSSFVILLKNNNIVWIRSVVIFLLFHDTIDMPTY